MKANTIESGKMRRGPVVAALAACAVALIAGLAVGFGKLREIYLEQCVVTDMARQVSIVSGKMVKADVIAENLGLHNGVNLALVDFRQKREDLLKRIPTLRTVSIVRKLPDRVEIVAEERVPIAKMGVRGRRAPTGRVVDAEGVVFPCMRGTQLLPTIVEPQPPGTATGQRLKGRALAALRLVETCREPEFGDLSVLDVDVSKPDYLLVTLGGSYARAKIAWDGMDGPDDFRIDDLRDRLVKLRSAIRANAMPDVKIWNATLPDRIFSDSERTN